MQMSCQQFMLLIMGDTRTAERTSTPDTPRQPTRLTTTNAVETNSREWGVNTCGKNLPRATDQTDSREVFTPYSFLLISVAFVVLFRVWSSLDNRCVSEQGHTASETYAFYANISHHEIK